MRRSAAPGTNRTNPRATVVDLDFGYYLVNVKYQKVSFIFLFFLTDDSVPSLVQYVERILHVSQHGKERKFARGSGEKTAAASLGSENETRSK